VKVGNAEEALKLYKILEAEINKQQEE